VEVSIFGKPVSSINSTDLQELLQERAVENVRLEFKSEVPNKDETLKKLSSFANTFGGYLVVGAKASGKDGRIESLPGVDIQSSYKQKIVQWCFDGSSPPLIVEVSDPTEISPGKVGYVIYVAQSDAAPHFLNGRNGVWVRADEFSAKVEARLASENELRELFDRRKLIDERRESLLLRARERFASHAAKVREKVETNLGKVGARLTLGIVPRFPSRILCNPEHLVTMIAKDEVFWRAGVFPRSVSSFVTQHESVIVLAPAVRQPSIFEANVWGMIFYATPIEGNHDKSVGIHLGDFVGHILVFLHHAGNMMKAFGYSGPLQIEIGLSDILGARWLYDAGGWLEPREGSTLDNSIYFSITASGDDLMARPDSIAQSILRVALFSMGWSKAVSTPSDVARLIRLGYLFNGWPFTEA
jgi:hypothetical protein